MKVNYFDIGIWSTASELRVVINNIFPALGITDYHAYGFEPCRKSFDKAVKRLNGNKRVTVLNVAISKEDGIKKLYHERTTQGHSLFDSKYNVDKNNYEKVKCIKFSNFLSTIPDIDSSINILRFNIEGSEWDLISDLVESKMCKKIHLYCGTDSDVRKIRAFRGHLDKYYKLIKDNNIIIHKFCSASEPTKERMTKIIKSEFLKMSQGGSYGRS